MRASLHRRRICRGSQIRRHVVEQLEERRVLAGDWQNPLMPLDVDGSGDVAPLDALLVICELGTNGSRELPPLTAGDAPPPYLDVDGNGWVDPVDAVRVIGALREGQRPLVLAASLSPDSDPNGNGVVLLPQVTVVGQTLPSAVVRAVVGQAFQPDSGADGALSSLSSDVLVVADGNGRFQFSVALAAGINTLRVEAVDRFGQRAAVEKTVRQGERRWGQLAFRSETASPIFPLAVRESGRQSPPSPF